MSRRRGLGALLALSALVGAAAGTVSYLYKYKKFSDAVDRDFTDVLDSASEVKDSAKRSYTTLRNSRTSEDLKAVAKDLGYAAKNLAIDTKNLAVDAGRDAYRAVKEILDSRFAGTPDAEDEDLADEDIEVEFYQDSAEPKRESGTDEAARKDEPASGKAALKEEASSPEKITAEPETKTESGDEEA